MTDFLLELRSEEIPARMQAGAREALARLFASEMDTRNQFISVDTVTYATPRRLTLISPDLPQHTASLQVELKGPRVAAPPQALDGFLRKNGLTRDQLSQHDGVWFANIDRPGRPMIEVLAEVIPSIVRAFPWPKSMRWGAASASTESLRWVRPLQGILALFGGDVVPTEIAGVVSGAATVGHRFHHPGAITIGSAADYVETLRAGRVIVDQDERAAIIREGASALAAQAGLALVADEGLVAENAGLTEWPVPLLGRFDPAFLDVPAEVIQLTARVNQKYFVCRDADGGLANAFICTANIDAADGGGKIVEGNRKVLAARLADARFFYQTDLKTPLEEQAAKLDRIVFHEKLGTVAQRVDRIVAIAADHLPEKVGWPETKARDMQPLLRKAAGIAKADLVSQMVGEFPELQGLMGYYYAQGHGSEVAEAVRDQYLPAAPSDRLPSGEVGTLLGIADRADALYGFFSRVVKPTGSRDPFALRRAALGIIRLIVENNLRLPLRQLFSAVDLERLFQSDGVGHSDPTNDLVDFIVDRLKVQQREAGVRHDLIDAVFALDAEDDLVRLLARVRALQSFVGTEDGANLLGGYKRAANILKKEGYPPNASSTRHPGLEPGSNEPQADTPAEGWTPGQARGDEVMEPAESALLAALDAAEPAAAAAIAREDFEGAMAALATLRAPIDAFFEQVTVNDPDPPTRERRLALLARVRKAVHTVADFSRIEG